MSVTFEWSAPITSAKNATVIVREALLPVLMWPSVPVVQEVTQELTLMEQFLIEVAALPDPITVDDVTEVTGIPRDVVGRIAGRLVGLDLLMPAANSFTLTEAAQSMPSQLSVSQRRVTRRTFLYLPEGDDLIAYQDGSRRTVPPMLHRVPPEATSPLPPEVTRQSLAAFLRERIDGRRVVGLNEDIVDVVDEQIPMPPGCPAYRLAGTVVRTSTDVRLRLATGRTEDRKPLSFTIVGASGQAACWSALTEWSDDAVAGWTATGGTVEATRLGPTRWSLTVDGRAATAAAETGIDLSRPAGLSTRSEACVVYTDVTFHPADHAARRLFAIQDALLRITSTVTDELTERSLPEAASAARTAYGLSDADLPDATVRDRLWTDGHYLHVYALRKDFVGYG